MRDAFPETTRHPVLTGLLTHYLAFGLSMLSWHGFRSLFSLVGAFEATVIGEFHKFTVATLTITLMTRILWRSDRKNWSSFAVAVLAPSFIKTSLGAVLILAATRPIPAYLEPRLHLAFLAAAGLGLMIGGKWGEGP